MTFVALLMGCGGQAQQAQPAQVQWVAMAQAEQSNAKQDKMYFIDFTTSWCGWCKKMESTTFADPVVSAILNQYYTPVKFNAEGKDTFTWGGTKYAPSAAVGSRNATHPFTRAVLGAKIGYPSFAIFSGQQTLVTILQGYQDAYGFSMTLWYLCSGDNARYTFETYQTIFDEKIKPGMMKKLGLAK